MERYRPETPEEAIHPVVGNLYIATSIKDVLNSYPFRREDIESDEINIRERRIRARLPLTENVAGFPGFVYIHGAKHVEEEHPFRLRRIPIFDHIGDLIIDVPERFNIKDLRSNNWESDLVLLARYDLRRSKDVFELEIYLDEILRNPKLSLPIRIMKPRLPSF